MNPTIYFSICSAIYCMLLILILFTGKKVEGTSKKILKILAVINFGNLLCEAIGIFLGKNYESFKLLNDISLRLMLVLYISWFSFFIIYVINISKNNKKLIFKDYWPICLTMILCIILAIVLPIKYVTNSNGVIIYSTGAAVDVIRYYTMAANLVSLFIMFKNLKKVKVSNYSSVFGLIILSTVAAMIQTYYPSLLLVSSVETCVLYIAYLNLLGKEISK